MSRRILALAAITLLPASLDGCKNKDNAPWKLPVEAKQLPSTTSVVEAELIEGMREPDPRLKQVYTSAELGAEVCREGSPDPAHQLELMSLLGPGLAKTFFT